MLSGTNESRPAADSGTFRERADTGTVSAHPPGNGAASNSSAAPPPPAPGETDANEIGCSECKWKRGRVTRYCGECKSKRDAAKSERKSKSRKRDADLPSTFLPKSCGCAFDYDRREPFRWRLTRCERHAAEIADYEIRKSEIAKRAVAKRERAIRNPGLIPDRELVHWYSGIVSRVSRPATEPYAEITPPPEAASVMREYHARGYHRRAPRFDIRAARYPEYESVYGAYRYQCSMPGCSTKPSVHAAPSISQSQTEFQPLVPQEVPHAA